MWILRGLEALEIHTNFSGRRRHASDRPNGKSLALPPIQGVFLRIIVKKYAINGFSGYICHKNGFVMHIAVAGNIGSGKTTLTRMLSQHYGWKAKYESVEFNPYLADFYKDMERWSFNLQIYFLNKRFKDVVEIVSSNECIIQDRTIYEDAKIFAPNLHAMGLMSTRDFENYTDLFDLMMSLVRQPDLMIYLRSSIPNLVANIQKRGREYENSIRIDYLKGLNERYEEWIAGYDKDRLLVVDTDTLRFESSPKDFETVVDRIDARLNGLF